MGLDPIHAKHAVCLTFHGLNNTELGPKVSVRFPTQAQK
jgi:hypothetical protein